MLFTNNKKRHDIPPFHQQSLWLGSWIYLDPFISAKVLKVLGGNRYEWSVYAYQVTQVVGNGYSGKKHQTQKNSHRSSCSRF
jgi:hypothetical protein